MKREFKIGDIVLYNCVIGKLVPDYDTPDMKFLVYYKKGNYTSSELPTVTSIDLEEPTITQKIHYIEDNCPWGKVIKTHIINNIQIIEYLSNPTFDASIGETKSSEIGFSIYLDWKSTCYGSNSLDSAIVTALSYKYGDEGFSKYVCKVLNIK
jgi:hypothetical protein